MEANSQVDLVRSGKGEGRVNQRQQCVEVSFPHDSWGYLNLPSVPHVPDHRGHMIVK
jgi:hypothetical protein